jgi:hypothetical protein
MTQRQWVVQRLKRFLFHGCYYSVSDHHKNRTYLVIIHKSSFTQIDLFHNPQRKLKLIHHPRYAFILYISNAHEPQKHFTSYWTFAAMLQTTCTVEIAPICLNIRHWYSSFKILETKQTPSHMDWPRDVLHKLEPQISSPIMTVPSWGWCPL